MMVKWFWDNWQWWVSSHIEIFNLVMEDPVDGGAWWAAVHGVARSRTQLSDFTFTSHFPALEKEMATHSSVLAWRIPGTGEPGGLLSLGSHRVGHDWSNLAAAQIVQVHLLKIYKELYCYYLNHQTKNCHWSLIMTYVLISKDIINSSSSMLSLWMDFYLWIYCGKIPLNIFYYRINF